MGAEKESLQNKADQQKKTDLKYRSWGLPQERGMQLLGEKKQFWLNSLHFLVYLCIKVHNTGHDVLHDYKYQILRIQKRNSEIQDVTHYFKSVHNCQNSTPESK